MKAYIITPEKLIDELNLLILKNIDASRGFLAAAYNISLHPLKEIFVNCSTQRYAFAEELQHYVKKLGNEPAGELSYPHVGKGLWADMSMAVNSDLEYPVWDACVSGEHSMLTDYDFLLDSNLSDKLNSIIEIQRNVVSDTLQAIEMLEMAA